MRDYKRARLYSEMRGTINHCLAIKDNYCVIFCLAVKEVK